MFSSNTQRGQGMSEYLIMVGVIAVASITVFGLFGDTIEQQVNGVSAILSGETSTAVLATAVDNTNDMNLEGI